MVAKASSVSPQRVSTMIMGQKKKCRERIPTYHLGNKDQQNTPRHPHALHAFAYTFILSSFTQFPLVFSISTPPRLQPKPLLCWCMDCSNRLQPEQLLYDMNESYSLLQPHTPMLHFMPLSLVGWGLLVCCVRQHDVQIGPQYV